MGSQPDSGQHEVTVGGTKFTITVDYYETKAGTVLVDQITEVYSEDNLIDELPERTILSLIEAVPCQQ
jgi:hypothetical protein